MNKKNETKDMNKKNGVLLFSDINQQWMLNWWYSNYIKHNNKPVCIVSYGLDKEFKDNNSDKFIFIEFKAEDFIDDRPVWCNIPIAMSYTPFDKTIFMGNDCEVKGNIDILYSYSNFATVRQNVSTNYCKDPNKLSDGIIVYDKGSKVLKDYIDVIKNIKFYTPEGALNCIYNGENIKSIDNKLYSTRLYNSKSKKSLIHHYTGLIGKNQIRKMLNLPEIEFNGLMIELYKNIKYDDIMI